MSIAKEIRMRSWKPCGGLVILGALALPVAWAQPEGQKAGAPAAESRRVEKPKQKPTTRPVAAKGDDEDLGADAEEVKVLVPVEKIKSLTDGQMAKLREIAARAEREKEAIMDKAREESFALLTEEQVAELAAYKEKAQAAAAERKAEAQKRREERQKARAERAKLKGEKKGKGATQGTAGTGTGQPK
jgi:hypothetical protein